MISCSHWGMFGASDAAIDEIWDNPLMLQAANYQNFERGMAYQASDLACQMLIGGACSDYYDSRYLHQTTQNA